MAGLFDRDRLISLLKRDALRFGQFLLASGKTSHFYVDGRRVTLSAEGARLIGEGILDILRSRPEVEAIGGLTLGADPIVGAVLALAPARQREGLRGFLVRKESKAHGTGRLVEGPLEPGMVVAIVDDVATTGGSSLKAVEAVEAIGCRVACVIAVLDRLEGAAETFRARSLDFFALATIDELGVHDHPGEVEPGQTPLADVG
ncbi:MAG: orotate phosphoribosyltransferase [Isosphaeraceae bacterium]|jgi:orotate phosphoribosyltransferase|nr:MAG: orotate phosphoribosyltransferase [Isosphaeraceae bacterium]